MAVDKKTLRLLDANLNRAREGLRVIEDTARFLWKEDTLYRSLRNLRHQLHKVTASSYKDLLKSRDSVQDSGRPLKESSRSSVSSIVSANIRRSQEAARVLEEYSKVFSPTAAARFKKIRFQLYIEEKKILQHL